MRTLRLLVLALLAASTLMAGGDKVRGEKGQGGVNQVQVQDPAPFQEPESRSLLDWLLGWVK